MEISKNYDPASVEQRTYAMWESGGYFKDNPGKNGEKFSLVMPPPNVTGILHMGHALDNVFQDILIRWKRMQGFTTLWVPGTDHAGIATQNVVEKRLRSEGKTRHSLGREEFVKRVWAWKNQHGDIITQQLRRLGNSCDWSHESFTLSAGFTKAVEHTFIHLYERGLLYRGKYLINWCPRCMTALSNEEAIPKEQDGNFWYIKYPLEGREGHVTVATTRPETMFGDTAVAVNPADKHMAHLIGAKVRLPFIGRIIPVVGDHRVKFGEDIVGTGALKVTPAHDPVDFEIGRDHGLAQIEIFTPEAKLNEVAEAFAGLDRFEARKQVVDALKELGLLEKIESTVHAIGHCERCDTVLEPRLSPQWFVKMKPLAEPAMKAHRNGDIKWYPERWGKYYERWMQEIRDWCISRQLWWGHRIPAWYCLKCNEQHTLKSQDGGYLFNESAKPIIAPAKPEKCPVCGGKDLAQDPDVLDTWFSSWIWPMATLGWPDETSDLKTYYPTNTLVTGQDIIFFWVARMIMAGFELRGKEPFSDIYIHGLVLDERGQIMHKSKGNGIDPLEMIEKYGSDALRFALVFLTSEGQDCLLSEDRINQGKRFCTKLWSASRFVLTNIQRYEPGSLSRLPLQREDLWILSRADQTVKAVSAALEHYRFNEALDTVYTFFWQDYCDAYLEMIKPRVYGNDETSKQAAFATAARVLETLLRLLHPFTPFITEEIWALLRLIPGFEQKDLIIKADFPKAGDFGLEIKQDLSDIDTTLRIVHELRAFRSKHNIPPGKQVNISLSSILNGDYRPVDRITANTRLIQQLGRVGDLQIVKNGSGQEEDSASLVVDNVKITLQLSSAIDLSEEKSRVESLIAKKQEALEAEERRLENPQFVSKARKEIVNQVRARVEALKLEIAEYRNNLARLKC